MAARPMALSDGALNIDILCKYHSKGQARRLYDLGVGRVVLGHKWAARKDTQCPLLCSCNEDETHQLHRLNTADEHTALQHLNSKLLSSNTYSSRLSATLTATHQDI